MSAREITLGADPATGEGGVTVPVYAQRHAYVAHRLGKFLDDLMASGQSLTPDAILGTVGVQAYALITAIIPTVEKRMSEWEFLGYASKDAMLQGVYDPAADLTSPSVPEILEAVRVGSEVVGLDVIRHLKGLLGLVDPQVLRLIVNEPLMAAIDSTSTTSPSSPSASGGSESTSSGMTPRTSTANGDSAFLAFAS